MRSVFLLLVLYALSAVYGGVIARAEIQKNNVHQKIMDSFDLSAYVDQAYMFLKKYKKVDDDVLKKLAPVYTIGVIDLAYGSITNFMRSKIAVQKMNQMYDWHKPVLYDVEKIHAGLDALNRLPITDDKYFQLNVSYYGDNSDMLQQYVQALSTIYRHVPNDILKVYVIEVLTYQKSGQKGIFSKYKVWKSADVAQYDPQWPDTVNSDGDYVGDPTTVQKIYACMQGVESIFKKNSLDMHKFLNPAATLPVGHHIEPVINHVQRQFLRNPILNVHALSGNEQISHDVIADEITRPTSLQDINSHFLTPDRGQQIQAAGGGVVDIDILNKGLWHAVKVNNIDDVKFFIFRGAQINSQDETGATALMYAVIADRYDMVKLLLAYSAQVNAQDHNGQTALHYAVMCHNKAIVQALLAAGADKNISDVLGNTPVGIAIFEARQDLIDVLQG